MNVTVRAYVPSDWSAIEKIHDEARKTELKLAESENAFLPLKIAAAREGLLDYEGLFVAELEGAVVGFVACSQEELAWLYVAPRHMRQGVGRTLAAYALNAFPDIRHTEVLKGNEPARGLYESLGFRVKSVEKGVMPGNEAFAAEAYVMQRTTVSS